MRRNKQSRLTRKRRGISWHVLPEHIVLPVLLCASTLGGCLSEKSHSTADAAANGGAANGGAAGGAAGGDAALTGTRALCVPDSDPYRRCADFGRHLYVCYVPVLVDDCVPLADTRTDGGQGRCCP
jgi:hypothetical protein